MNTPLETATPAPARTERVKVWDLPVRLFHWLMVLCFAGVWLTHDSDALRFWHVLLGYTLFGLLLFRLLWGLIGTRHARFASFVRGPRAIRAYVSGKSGRHLGHNPAGAVAVVLLLLLLLGQVISGWQMVAGPTGFAEFWEEAHEVLANATLAMVGLHLAGVLWSSLRHRENLVASLFHGKKRAEAGQEGIATSRV